MKAGGKKCAVNTATELSKSKHKTTEEQSTSADPAPAFMSGEYLAVEKGRLRFNTYSENQSVKDLGSTSELGHRMGIVLAGDREDQGLAIGFHLNEPGGPKIHIYSRPSYGDWKLIQAIDIQEMLLMERLGG